MKQKKNFNKRVFRNTVMVLMVIILALSAVLTVSSAKNSSALPDRPNLQSESGDFQGGPPSMNFDKDSDSPSSDSDSSSSQPPEMPSGDNSSNQPPEMPSGDSSNQPPELPDGENFPGNPPSSSGSSDSSEDSSSDSSVSDSSNTENRPQLPDNIQKSGNKYSVKYYIAFALENVAIVAIILYLIMSRGNKRGVRESLKGTKRILIFALSLIILSSSITLCETALISSSEPTSMSQMGAPGSSGESVDASGATTVDGKDETLSDSYSSTTSDESAILVTNGGTATISGATVTKSGDSSNTESSEFYGVNAGVLVQENSSATIDGATISTDAKGANAVFSTGENSKIYITNSTITTNGESSSRGLDATYGGYIEADNVTITTKGGSCATLATDRGEGTVIANNSTLETNGAGSPVIYSTGSISIDNTKGTANGSQMVVIEGKNSATVTNSTLTASGAGNRGDVDTAGIMIYQSMSGDASEGTGTFTAKNSSLSVQSSSSYYKSAPMFFVTNTDAVINLTNTKLSFGSGVLLTAKGTDEWGNSGSNGGNVELNATSQTLEGDVEIDNISSADITLKNSTYKGTINGDNTAKEINLTLDKNSTITLTGDSYVTSLNDADTSYSNINFNGYTLYVNGKAIN